MSEKKLKKRKEFTRLNSIIRFALRKMYKKYGLEQSMNFIDNMKEPTDNEKYLLKQYLNELNQKAERQDGVDHLE